MFFYVPALATVTLHVPMPVLRPLLCRQRVRSFSSMHVKHGQQKTTFLGVFVVGEIFEYYRRRCWVIFCAFVGAEGTSRGFFPFAVSNSIETALVVLRSASALRRSGHAIYPARDQFEQDGHSFIFVTLYCRWGGDNFIERSFFSFPGRQKKPWPKGGTSRRISWAGSPCSGLSAGVA